MHAPLETQLFIFDDVVQFILCVLHTLRNLFMFGTFFQLGIQIT